MNANEAHAVLMIFSLNCDRQIPEGLPEVWHAALDDLPFELGRAAAIELVRTNPHFPRVAEVRDRARLIREQRKRDARRTKQLEGPPPQPANPARTGAAMVRHVLGRLADAGQDIPAGKLLGPERAGDIAQAAVTEWLDNNPTTGHQPPTHAPARTTTATDLARCTYRLSTTPGICADCDFPHGHARHQPFVYA